MSLKGFRIFIFAMVLMVLYFSTDVPGFSWNRTVAKWLINRIEYHVRTSMTGFSKA